MMIVSKIQKNYLILPHSELFLRFNYGRLILDNENAPPMDAETL